MIYALQELVNITKEELKGRHHPEQRGEREEEEVHMLTGWILWNLWRLEVQQMILHKRKNITDNPENDLHQVVIQQCVFHQRLL